MPRSANPTTPKRRSKTKSRKNEIGSDSESVSEFEFTLNGKLIPKGTLNIYKVSQLADALHTSSPAKRLKVPLPSSPKLVRTESGPLQAAIDNLQIQVQGPSTTKKQNEESKENLERSIESEAELEEDEEIVKLVKFLLDAKKGK
jgi:hypothetical protein